VPYFVDRVRWLYLHMSYALEVVLHPQDSATAINKYLSRIKGGFPRENANGVIFFACDDLFMEHFGYNLIFSCYETMRECGVHVHLYEPSTAIVRRLVAMTNQFPDLKLSYTYEEAIDVGSLPERGMYYTAFRFVAAKKVSEESQSVLVCLDADSLIMNSLQQVITKARQYDVGLYFRPHKRQVHKKIVAFCVIVTPTKPARDFLTFFSGLALKFHQHYPNIRSPHWIDQSGLYVAYLWGKFRDRVSFWSVGKGVVDYDFSTAACIWTAKGKQKQNEVFLQASHRLREKYAVALGSQASDYAAGSLPV